MKNVDIALLIWQRNRVDEFIHDGPDVVPVAVLDAWQGIMQALDSIIDEAHPVGTPLPPPYRPWRFYDGVIRVSRPQTTRECFIDYIDAHGGLTKTHNLWSEYSEYCREAGVDPLIKEET